MSQNSKKKNDNVVVDLANVVHNFNNRSISQEEFARVLKGYHQWVWQSKQYINQVKMYLDEAFTKYPNSNSSYKKLKDFEVHESRNYGLESAQQFENLANAKLNKLEKLSREKGVEFATYFYTEEQSKIYYPNEEGEDNE